MTWSGSLIDEDPRMETQKKGEEEIWVKTSPGRGNISVFYVVAEQQGLQCSQMGPSRRSEVGWAAEDQDGAGRDRGFILRTVRSYWRVQAGEQHAALHIFRKILLATGLGTAGKVEWPQG